MLSKSLFAGRELVRRLCAAAWEGSMGKGMGENKPDEAERRNGKAVRIAGVAWRLHG